MGACRRAARINVRLRGTLANGPAGGTSAGVAVPGAAVGAAVAAAGADAAGAAVGSGVVMARGVPTQAASSSSEMACTAHLIDLRILNLFFTQSNVSHRPRVARRAVNLTMMAGWSPESRLESSP